MDFLKYFSVVLIITTMMLAYAESEITSNTIVKEKPTTEKSKIPEPGFNLIEALKKQIESKENELHKGTLVDKNVEKMLKLVNLLGQIDTFLTEKTKTLIKKLADMSKSDEDSNSVPQ